MHRRPLRILLALSVALAPLTASSQERYYFRNVQGSGAGQTNPNPNPANPASISVQATINAQFGETVNVVPTASNLDAPVAWSYTGTLPSGFGVSPTTGAITGSPQGSGTFDIVLRAESGGRSAQAPVRLVLTNPAPNPPVIGSYQSSFEFLAGQAFSIPAPGVTGGTPPYAYSIAPGTFPFSFSTSTGAVSWSSPIAGSYPGNVVSVVGGNSSNPFSITVYPAFTASLSGTLPSVIETNAQISPVSIVAEGGKGPYTYAASGLPAGLSLVGTTLSGVPEVPGNYNITLTATESFASQVRTLGPYAVTVSPPQTLEVSATTSLPTEAMVGRAIAPVTFQHTGGSGTVSYEISGTPPAGINLVGNTLSGTPEAGTDGSYNFFVRGIDSGVSPQDDYVQVSLTVYDAFTAAVSATPQATVTVGSAIANVNLVPNGGKGPYIYTSTGTLPQGVTFSNAGLLSGIPTEIGDFAYTLRVTHSFSGAVAFATPTYTLKVNDTPAIGIAPATPQTQATRNVAIAATNLNPSGGNGQYTYALVGNPPPGLGFSGNQLTGTPTANGDYSFQIRVTDSTPGTQKSILSASTYTMAVRDPVLMTSTVFANATANTPYSYQLTASGGTAPYTFTVTGLPATLTPVPANGLISGTPNSAQNYTSLSVTVTDSVGRTDTKTASLTVLPPPPAAIPRPNAVDVPGAAGGQGAYVVAGGVNGFYDADATSGYNSFAGNEGGGMPRTTASYTWTAANKGNCAIVGINNRGVANKMSVRFMSGGTVLGNVEFNTPSGLSQQTVVSNAAGNPDINRMDLLVNTLHTNYLAHTFKAGAWDGTTCITSP